MTAADRDAGRQRLPAGVWVIAAAVVVVLMAVAGRYGFHRDEYYFVVTGRHLAWAAPDNPMLVPYLAAGWYWLVGGTLWAFRILPALAAAGYVVVGGLIAREYSPLRRHQVAGAAATAFSGVVLPVGHLFSTTTFDMLFSAAALWLLIRALRAQPQRWAPWIGFGLVAGVAMEIKVLLAPVVLCALLGLLVFGPRRVLTTSKPWVGAAIAAVLASPNLIWQAVHGFPQATVAGQIASGGSTSSTSRLLLLPLTILEIGPIAVAVLIVGLVCVLSRPRRARDGWLGFAFLAFVVLMLVSGGKAYYPAAFYPALMAAGSGPLLDAIVRHRRERLAGVVFAASVIITVGLTLPVFPVGSSLFRVGMGPNPDMGETVGWDGYVATVADVARALPAADSGHTVILTQNYGEAGALTLARATHPDLPPVYSGHDAFFYWGPPAESATTTIVVGKFPPQLARAFSGCTVAALLTSPAGVDNGEKGAPVRVCTARTAPWAVLWPQLRH